VRPRILPSLLVVAAIVLSGCAGTPDAGPTPTPTERAPSASAAELIFDENRAYALAAEQLTAPNGTLRVRTPGTEGNDQVAALIRDKLSAWGWRASFDNFTATYGCKEVAMHNVVGVLNPGKPAGIMVGTHYDSRPIAEKDPDPARRDWPTPGANDGAAGTGVLLELARVLAERVRNHTLTFVFFDGEDGGGYLGDHCTDWILGSTHHAATVDPARVRGMILLDLIGSENLSLPWEGHSRSHGPSKKLQERIWATGQSLGYGDVFLNQTSAAITDDHVPYQARGIPSVDIIDLKPYLPDARGQRSVFFKWHHTTMDDMSHVDKKSLRVVGRTVERLLLDFDAQPPSKWY
jgi:glutaminyl-peptide cyclotransferase